MPLQWIWLSVVFLAVVSMATLASLIVRRAIDERREKRSRSSRRIIQEILFRYMVADSARRDQDLSNLMNFRRRDKDVIRKLAIDLFHLIKGSERNRLETLLRQIGLREDCLYDLRRASPRLRRLAAAALQVFDDEECRAALIKALDDKDIETRIAAADSLLFIGHLPDINFLMDKLSPAVRQQSRDVRTLFRDISRKQPQKLLTRVASGGLSRKEKLLLAEAMANSGDYRVLDILIDWAEDPDVELRAAAIRALAVLQHPRAAPQILRGLKDMSWQVRAVAARAAWRIGLPESVGLLNFLLDDRNWWVRFRAAEALFKLGQDGINVLEVRAQYAGCQGFGRGSRMAALVLDERGHPALTEEISTNVGEVSHA